MIKHTNVQTDTNTLTHMDFFLHRMYFSFCRRLNKSVIFAISCIFTQHARHQRYLYFKDQQLRTTTVHRDRIDTLYEHWNKIIKILRRTNKTRNMVFNVDEHYKMTHCFYFNRLSQKKRNLLLLLSPCL